MKKTITRFQAQKIYDTLSGMALGHLSPETLEAVIDDFAIIKNEVDNLNRIKLELSSRIYQDVDGERLRGFLIAVKNNDNKTIAESYEDLITLYNKELDVLVKVYNKEIEVDVAEVDWKEFRLAVLKSQPNTKQSAFEVLAPLFKAEEKATTDYAELDDYLATIKQEL